MERVIKYYGLLSIFIAQFKIIAIRYYDYTLYSNNRFCISYVILTVFVDLFFFTFDLRKTYF